MASDPEVRRRRSIRLRGYDYSFPGAYYLTICSSNKRCLFGRIVGEQMQPNEWGQIVREEWFRSAQIRREIQLDAFVLMPNHIHGIVTIASPPGEGSVGAQGLAPLRGRKRVPMRKPHSLASFVWGFKTAATRRINETRNAPGAALWQRNYYEHVVCNDGELEKIREYIMTNPLRWAWDGENPEAETVLDDDPWL